MVANFKKTMINFKKGKVMKTLMLILAIAFIQLTAFAQTESSQKTETVEFKVYGNCGMCKSRIEKALKVEGVESSKWDAKTDMVKVVFHPDKINEDKLHQLVADVGHDTEKVKAKNETYDNLHSCCKYDRSEMKTDGKENLESHKH
jgi:copper chaperone CopZ